MNPKTEAALDKIIDAAHECRQRRGTPEPGADLALRTITWAMRNAKSKGPAFSAGFVQGISTATTGLSSAISGALFAVGQLLEFPDADPPSEETIAAVVRALDAC